MELRLGLDARATKDLRRHLPRPHGRHARAPGRGAAASARRPRDYPHRTGPGRRDACPAARPQARRTTRSSSRTTCSTSTTPVDSAPIATPVLAASPSRPRRRPPRPTPGRLPCLFLVILILDRALLGGGLVRSKANPPKTNHLRRTTYGEPPTTNQATDPRKASRSTEPATLCRRDKELVTRSTSLKSLKAFEFHQQRLSAAGVTALREANERLPTSHLTPPRGLAPAPPPARVRRGCRWRAGR